MQVTKSRSCGVGISDIYHFLRAAFGQGVTIAQIVHFNVADIVTVLLVDVVVERATGLVFARRLDGSRVGTGARVLHAAVSSLLESAAEACLTARMGGTSTCCGPFFALSVALIFAAAAAAAAAASFLPSAEAGLRMGLRDLRMGSAFRSTGERERRSKRDLRGASGSV